MSQGSQNLDPEQQDILLGFIEEGREMLDEVEPLLIELEHTAETQGSIDPEMVNKVFRLFHSLKGGAGFLDLGTISKVTHVAETLLDLFRKGLATLESSHVDLMNRTGDFIRTLLDQIEVEYHDHGFEEEADEIVRQLTSTIEVLKGGNVDSKADEPPSAAANEGETSAGGTPPQEGSEEVSAEAVPDPFQLTISPEIIKQFTSESLELLEKAEASLLDLENQPADPEDIQQAFRSFHSFKGNAGFLGYSDMEKLSHGAESVLEQFRGGELNPSAGVISLLLDILDFLKGAVASVDEGGSPDIPATPGLQHLLEDIGGTPPPAAKEEPPANPPEPEKKAASEPELQPPLEVSQDSASSHEKPAPSREIKIAEKPKRGERKETASGGKGSLRQSVRVDVEKLDELLDLVGELVISEAMVSQNPDVREANIPLDRFEKAVLQLDKITRDLQDVATSIRMIPLAGTFRRMVRLVRDLSQKAGKKVDLSIVGEETEVDKTVIEQITDPLVHIIRNSIDHGLEPPEVREKAGKEPTGNLVLEAKYVGGEVWIVIRDDGRGLNRAKILSRAKERGLLEAESETLSDNEVWQFIFQPGFSTAEKVTDVSGRGVGMDVVRRNIESIHGKVDIRSHPGSGTDVILRLPLTLAIIDGMIVRVGGERYTLPITSIRESIQVQQDQVTRTMDGQEIIRVRDTLIPVVRLHELFDIETPVRELHEGIVSIIENDGRQVGLFVDTLIGQHQVVIKGIAGYLKNHPCVSGCTILGDGEISLILDVAGVITVSEKHGEQNSVKGVEVEQE